ncbi:MAG: bifunctional enoyl-CoA hydratase/phosphate acetyltransferase [Pseudomonadota bacterium]
MSEVTENRTYDEINVGDAASIQRVLTEKDIALFAGVSGDVNPAHLDDEYAQETPFHGVVGHGMWGGSLISAVLGAKLPGHGTIYVSQQMSFRRPVRIGDELTVTVRAVEKKDRGRIVFDCACVNQDGADVIVGRAEVIAPTEKITRPAIKRPETYVHEGGRRLKALVARAETGEALRTAIVHPTNAISIEGALAAEARNLIAPVFVGPRGKIEAAAEAAGADISAHEIVDAPHSHAAADKAVELVRRREVGALMKGALHTDELMGAVVARATGIRTERRVSHVYVMDTPAYPKILFISDAAINIEPDLNAKRDIAQNAIDLARALGLPTPKVAVLSAMETVYPPVPSTIDAAALCKMADRGQIVGGLIDGPLAFDNAISPEAVAAKGIASEVAGDADILLVPDLESGNMLAKQLDYLAGAVAAGIVLGAQVPIILTSRAEGVEARVAASALTKLFAQHGQPAKAGGGAH